MKETDILTKLKQGNIELPPLKFSDISIEVKKRNISFDAILRIKWGKVNERFVVEVRSPSTPKNIRNAILNIKASSKKMKLNPLIIVPYLPDDAMRNLEQEGISGFDLCGNGLIVVEGKLYFSKTGNKNLFPNSAPIKNVYSRNSSLVGRIFLVCPCFSKVGDILEEINCRLPSDFTGSRLTLSTVSKCLKSMEQDLIIGRDDNGIKLLQPDKLITKLFENYIPPKTEEKINWEIPTSGNVRTILPKVFKRGIQACVSGISSSNQYSVMQREETISVYTVDPDRLIDDLPGKRNDRFPSLSLIKTEDMSAYFDFRADNKGVNWASPVQVYFELMSGDKRDQETAQQLKEYILTTIKEYGNG